MCEIYSKKKYNGKYYCASHYKMIEIIDKKESEESNEQEVESSPEIEKKEVKKEVKKEPKKEVKKEEPKKEVAKEEPKKVVNKVPKKKKSKIISVEEKSESSEVEDLTLETHKLDDVIESEYKKALKKYKSKSDMDKLRERVDYIFNKMNEIDSPKKLVDEFESDQDDELPGIERFN